MDRDNFVDYFVSSALRTILDVKKPIVGTESLNKLLEASRESIKRNIDFIWDIYKSLLNLAGNIYDNLEREVHDKWNPKIIEQLCRTHVFCVAENKDDVVMWSHYAAEHKGVVFELNCIDEIDNPLLMATKVKYSEKCIPFPDAMAYAQHLTGEKRIDMVDIIWNMATTKHTSWGYEKEWRVRMPAIVNEDVEKFIDVPENVRVFGGMYFGCKIEPEIRSKLLNLAKRNYPGMKIYQAEKSYSSFNLTFLEVV